MRCMISQCEQKKNVKCHLVLLELLRNQINCRKYCHASFQTLCHEDSAYCAHLQIFIKRYAHKLRANWQKCTLYMEKCDVASKIE